MTQKLIEQRLRRRRRAVLQQWTRSLRRTGARFRSLQFLLLPLGILGVVALLFMVIVLLFFSPWTTLREIRVVRQDPRIDIAHVQQALAPLFGRRLFLLQTADAHPLLRAALPDFQTVDIAVSYPSALRVHITLDPIVARLRIVVAEEEEVTGSGAAIGDFLTKGGVYVRYAPALIRGEGQLPLLRVTDWGARPQTGARILPSAFLARLVEAEEVLQRDFGQEIRDRLLFLRAREFHLRTDPWWLWFDLRDPITEQVQRYRTFLHNIPREQVRDHIDLRLRDRVVYK